MPPGFQCHIDYPNTWHNLKRRLWIRGWCFGADGRAITGIRLVLPDRIITGTTGLPRPDVRTALPHAPHDNTGFELRSTVRAGTYSIALEARLANGSWQCVVKNTVKVQRDLLPPWLRPDVRGELMDFQMLTHAIHAPRPVRIERYPVLRSRATPSLTIVTPSFQQAAFLDETIRSVLSDPPPGLAYVVQDGGSTDGSVNIIRSHERIFNSRTLEVVGRKSNKCKATQLASNYQSAAPCFQNPANTDCEFVWSSEPDGGQADAITRGFAKTSGGPDDIMAWLNSDDLYLPGALRFVADYFARHPDVDAIYGHRILVDECSQEIGRWFLPQHDPEVLHLNDFVPQETLFWRRRIWDNIGGLDTSFRFAMDWDLLLRFQAAGAKIVRVPYFLGCFRIHATQKTSAQMHSVGQAEIDNLRGRTFGRVFAPEELKSNRRLQCFLRRSMFIEFLWKVGLRAP